MNRVSILCNKDATMMNEFNRMCIDDLNEHFMFSLFLPLFHEFMVANVQKETDKDRLIIEHAGSAFMEGKSPEDVNADAVFETTKDVDRGFLKKISHLPLLVMVKYDDIKDTRIDRIRLLTLTVFELLGKWGSNMNFSDAVRNAYSEGQFKKIINGILRLYNRETKILAESINVLPPINIAKDIFVETLFGVMEKAREETSRELVRMVYAAA